MGLLSKTVMIKWNSRNKKCYESKGYVFTKMGDEFEVKIEDLSCGTDVLVEVKCDNKNCENLYSKLMKWCVYLRYVKKDGKYYCHKCNMKLNVSKNISKSLLIKNGKSFEQWCVENNREDILEKWDYELNNCKPSEITYGTKHKYYFKCPQRIHKSELKNINSFISGHNGSMDCNQCNSFAQWGIDNICEDFLEKYWDYDKNTVNPWEISRGNRTKKVWIKCQEKDYHDSYDVLCNSFVNAKSRCPYCNRNSKKVHMLDSLGVLYPESLNVWSDKNKKSPFEYALFSVEKVYWKCHNSQHEDYLRSISSSNVLNFRCPECQYSKGENTISLLLNYNKINYIPQKTFKDLIGLGGGLLSYDFYLPDYNLLIEYQGEQHDRPVDFYNMGIKKTNLKFKKQLKHDQLKREYALKHNIKLLEIWYYDFDNIKEILNKELQLNIKFIVQGG